MFIVSQDEINIQLVLDVFKILVETIGYHLRSSR
jgi:hypothetical protein